MIGTFDLQNLDRLLKDFHTAVGIRISIFDDGFDLVTEYPKTAPAFCRGIRMSESGRKACKDCDRAACERAKKLRAPHIYTCHAGITEAITPIEIGGGVLGYAILAHMLPTEDYEAKVETACSLARGFGMKREDSMLAIRDITPRTTEQINAAVSLLDAVSSYVYIRNLVKWKTEDISADIDRYIRANLGGDLSNASVSRYFGCSRTALYNISMRAFGMGIMQYVTYLRMEKAKQLLAQGKNIAEVAGLCGYSEYNYFCKVFRKTTGISPGRFAKQGK